MILKSIEKVVLFKAIMKVQNRRIVIMKSIEDTAGQLKAIGGNLSDASVIDTLSKHIEALKDKVALSRECLANPTAKLINYKDLDPELVAEIEGEVMSIVLSMVQLTDKNIEPQLADSNE